MNWRRLFRLSSEPEGSTPGPDSDFWYGNAGAISAQDALQIPVILCCARALAESLAGLPFQVYRRQPNGDREIAFDHPLYRVIHDSPNPYFTAYEFWAMVMWSLMFRGNFLAVQHTSARNDVAWLDPLDWSRVQVTKDRQTGIRVFRYTDENGEAQLYTDSDVLFIPGVGYDGMQGKSLIEFGRAAASISKEAQAYVQHYFANNGIPAAYVSFPNAMGEKQKTDWSNWFKKNFGGARNSGKLGIFDNGGKIETVNLDHSKMQLNELRASMVAEWCRIFRVPAHIAQDLTRSTNNNIEHQGMEFWVLGVKPWADLIEGRVNMSLLGEREGRHYFAEFNMDAILRGDSVSRAQYLTSMVAGALMTPNEGRKKENLPAIEGGDSLYMQGAMVRLEDIPTASEAAASKAAGTEKAHAA